MKSGVVFALAAAALFGASTPFAKLLVGQIPPITLAGLLYLGSGTGLLMWLLLRRQFTVADSQNEPHTHEHNHAPLRHAHPHYPDVHHRHIH